MVGDRHYDIIGAQKNGLACRGDLGMVGSKSLKKQAQPDNFKAN